MLTHLKLLALAFALAVTAGTALAQTGEQQAPLSIPGVIVLPPPPPPSSLPAGGHPEEQTCPATDLKKLDLIG